MNKNVVVTGLGVVSSIGIGKDIFWTNLIAGKSGIREISLFDTSKYKRHHAGEIKDFQADVFISKNMLPFLGRASQFAVAATKLALEDANIKVGELKNRKAAIVLGATLPEGNSLDVSAQMLLQKDTEMIVNRDIMHIFPPSIPANIANMLGIKEINVLIPCACAAGNYAVGYGFNLIKRGIVDLAIVGGSEALSRLTFQGFQRLNAMANELCAPFDKNRDGMLLGEGAGILILESLAQVKKRKSVAYAQVLGYGLSCDAHHITIPTKEGIKKVMKKALIDANISERDVHYINAHGTGTHANDRTEALAIQELFGSDHKGIPVSSIKSMLGHCMGAASSIEAITCCMALREQIVPPTINFKTPDPECDIDCVPNYARKVNLKTVLNNAFAFGGNNCSVVFASADRL
jgi:3-oxoacyl-[acyl-carrier-protein] synthase II